MIPEWRLQMMANLIFRKYLSEKDKVLALANSILEAHIDDTEETKSNDALIEAKKVELALKDGDVNLQNHVRDITANINSCL